MIPQTIEPTPDRPYCWAEHDGYLCTRDRGHDGVHEAGYLGHDGHLAIAHTWRQTPPRVDVDELAANLDVAADNYRATMMQVVHAATDDNLLDWLTDTLVSLDDVAPEELRALVSAIRDHQDATVAWERASDALDGAA